jgi:putative transposase
MLHVQEAMPEVKVAKLCRLFEVPRSSFYYRSSRRDESEVKKAVEDIAAAWPRFGYEGLTGQLRFEEKSDPRGKPIGERRVKRMLKELGLLRKPHARKVRTTNSEHGLPRFENLVKDRRTTYPDEIWASDITYVKLGTGFVYLSVILDLFTRSIRGWHLSRSLGGEATLIALKKALDSGDRCAAHHGGRCPQIHHSDQGVQYAADDYVKLLQSRGVAISMAAVGCPEENGFAERWMRTLKEDHVSMSEYAGFLDCQAQIGEFIEEVYQRKRVHSSLGYLPPAVFEERWWEAKARRGSQSDSGEPLVKLSKPLPVAGGSVTIPQT